MRRKHKARSPTSISTSVELGQTTTATTASAPYSIQKTPELCTRSRGGFGTLHPRAKNVLCTHFWTAAGWKWPQDWRAISKISTQRTRNGKSGNKRIKRTVKAPTFWCLGLVGLATKPTSSHICPWNFSTTSRERPMGSLSQWANYKISTEESRSLRRLA